MNISALAQATGTTTDTLRYYEKLGLLDAPVRAENGYRRYADDHIDRVRFVRSAQSLGFSLAEIRSIIPQLAAGQLRRTQIEQSLRAKVAQIDAHIQELRQLKRELKATFDLLTCERDAPVSETSATRHASKYAEQNAKPARAAPVRAAKKKPRARHTRI